MIEGFSFFIWVHMIADIMFSLIFLPGHLQQVGDAGSVSFSHDSICRVKISQAL